MGSVVLSRKLRLHLTGAAPEPGRDVLLKVKRVLTTSKQHCHYFPAPYIERPSTPKLTPVLPVLALVILYLCLEPVKNLDFWGSSLGVHSGEHIETDGV